MNKYNEFIEKYKNSSRIYSCFTEAKKYDPLRVIEVDEYLELLLNSTKNRIKNKDFYQEHYSDFFTDEDFFKIYENGPVAHLLFDEKYTDEDRRRAINKLFSRQDDLVFIRENRDTSCAFLYRTLPAHWHSNNYFDIKYVMDGEGIFFFRDETLRLHKGDVLIVPPEIEHGESCIDDSMVITCGIRIPAFTKLFFNLFEENSLLHSFFSRILSGNEDISYMLFRESEDNYDKDLRNLFIDLYTEQDSNLPYSNKMTDNIVSQIFLQLLRYHENQLVLPAGSSLYWKPEYGEIFSYINANYKTVSLAELETQFHYSRRQLIRIIEGCTGQTLSSLLIAMKMNYAKEMLNDTSLAIEEIAILSGYESFSSFSRAFKKYYGTSPSSYRH